MVGGWVFAGVTLSAITGLGFVFARPVPSALRAVTIASTVWPTSAAARRYDPLVSPGMVEHAAPLASQRCQTYEKDVGLFDQAPFEVVIVEPRRNVPSSVGCAVSTGAAASAVAAATRPVSETARSASTVACRREC